MTTDQLAAVLQISPHSVRAWVRRGKLSPRHHGRSLVFTPADVGKARELQAELGARGRRSDLYRPAGRGETSAYIDVDQAAALLNVTTRTVRRLAADGELQAWRTALSPTSFLREQVEQLAAARKAG